MPHGGDATGNGVMSALAIRVSNQAKRARIASAALGVAVMLCGGVQAATGMSLREVTEILFQSRHSFPAELSRSVLAGFDLSGVDFKSAHLIEADLFGADLTKASLAGADLTGARLDRAVLTGAEFSTARLNGATILNPTVFTTLEPDLSEAPRFAGARMPGVMIAGLLNGADFRWADLTGALFGLVRRMDGPPQALRVSLANANFSEASLANARLAEANLKYAKFVNADLRGANLSGANLTLADFTGADVSGADFTGAELYEAVFRNARGLDQAKGLASARNADRIIRE